MVAGGQWPVAVSLLEALKTEQLEADLIAARHVNRGFGWTILRKQAIIGWPAKCRILRAGKVEQSEQFVFFCTLAWQLLSLDQL